MYKLKSKWRFVLILIMGSFVSNSVCSQINYQIWINESWNSTPLLSTNFTVDGSPFIPDKFYKATVFLKDGKFYENQLVKLYLPENMVLFLGRNQKEMITTDPIFKVMYTDAEHDVLGMVFESGFEATGKLTSKTFYQVLETGKAKLLKHIIVDFMDQKGQPETLITRYYTQKNTYYISINKTAPVKLEKGKEGIIKLLSDKKNQIEKYISDNKLKCKSDEDWKLIVNYYNSLID